MRTQTFSYASFPQKVKEEDPESIARRREKNKIAATKCRKNKKMRIAKLEKVTVTITTFKCLLTATNIVPFVSFLAKVQGKIYIRNVTEILVDLRLTSHGVILM